MIAGALRSITKKFDEWLEKLEYNTFTEDDIIGNSQDIEESNWVLKEDPEGFLAMGFDPLPREVIRL